MLRTAIAVAAAVAAIGLVGVPTAQAAPRICASNCSVAGNNSGGGVNTAVRGPNKPPNASQHPRAIAVHRVADPISKRIIDKLKKVSSHFN